ncbi:MAG: serine dehydratase beta chain, partial [Ruegeria sp.]
MFLSVFDMFKVGVGPSSSHTMGPMVAAARFLDLMRASPFEFSGLRGSLHGSLAFTGVGHATDRATILGLAGFTPDSYDHDKAEAALAAIADTRTVTPEGLPTLKFDPKADLLFDYDNTLPGHANGMILMATDAQGDVILRQVYYSIGGGFVLTEEELAEGRDSNDGAPVPYPFHTAAEMLEMANASGKTIADMKRANEVARGCADSFTKGTARIWEVMNNCIERGLATDGILPGGLKVRRRAKGIHDALMAERGMNLNAPHTINDWMSVYAMAVNEENAAGGQVVTAPTNGAAGTMPAVLRYYLDHGPRASESPIGGFLPTAPPLRGAHQEKPPAPGRRARVPGPGRVAPAAGAPPR